MANEFYVRKGLIVSGSTALTGSLEVLQGITGSLYGTASWAENAVTASFALTPSGTSGTSGESGSSGSSGTSGESGTSGSSGTSGLTGSSGTSGTSGSDGAAGSSGTSGENGTSGTSGTSGENGSSGSSGSSGEAGTSGSSGTSGISGESGSSGSSGTSGEAGTSGTSGSSGTSGTSGTLTLTGDTDNGLITLNGTAPNATVESNLTFDGSLLTVNADQYVSGALTVNGLLTAVSMSTQYVTSSQYVVGTSRIILNDDDLVRFAGLSIIDSGSTPASASILWDSLNNHFIIETDDVHENTVDPHSAILIAGPETYEDVGNEIGLVTGRVPVAASDHNIDSRIASSSIRVDFPSRLTHIEAGLYVTGGITGSLLGTSSLAANAELLDGLDSSVFATTGSNTFTGIQTISNTTNATDFTNGALIIDGGASIKKDLYVQQDLNIGGTLFAGSQSILLISSSIIDIDNNRIVTNIIFPQRFGGLSVNDSGSEGTSGSLYWDSTEKRWLYQTPLGVPYNSAILIGGPQNTETLGNEVALTVGRVPVTSGDKNIDSRIASSSIRVDFPSRLTHIEAGLFVTGAVTSSISNAVGFFGTSSYAVSASFALTPSGTSGTSGINGSSGTSGANGSSGSSGTSGVSGSSGTSGESGSSGTSGENGSSGSSGTSGVDGTSGSSGTSGVNGAPGSSGSSGTSGTSGTLTLTGTTDNGVITLNGSAPNAAVESNLTFDGSLLNVTGRISASAGITGSLFGTSSWATNAVTASFLLGSVESASFAQTAATASSFSGSLQVVGLAEFGEGLIVSGGLAVNGGITGSLLGTSSWATNAISSSFATTASFALNASATAFTIDTYEFTGNGSQTSFNITKNYDLTSLIVSVDGLTFNPTEDYTVSGTNLNLVSAPPSQSIVLVRAFVNATENLVGSFTGSLLGTASYALASDGGGTKTLTMFTPLDNNPPATDFATLDTVNSIAVLDFDDAANESAVFVKFIPENTNLSSGIRTDLRWMATSATGGNAIWGVQFEKISGSALTDSFDTITIATGSTAATSGSVNITTITATTINGLTAGDLFKLKVIRSGSAAADTMTGDAELIAVELRAV